VLASSANEAVNYFGFCRTMHWLVIYVWLPTFANRGFTWAALGIFPQRRGFYDWRFVRHSANREGEETKKREERPGRFDSFQDRVIASAPQISNCEPP
jgi:hypothetical protein